MQPMEKHSASPEGDAGRKSPAPQSGGLNKILTAIVDEAPEGLIRAFRKGGSADISSNSTLSSSVVASDSYDGSDTPSSSRRAASSSMDSAAGSPQAQAAATLAAQTQAQAQAQAAAATAAATALPTSAPILLNAYRMLAVSPTLPVSMQRSQWSSYDYHILEKLYTGYASKVYKAVCKRSNEVVVLKSYQLSAICELYQHQIFREVGLHASLAHENVVQLSAAFQEGDFVVLVQEYAAGGNLFELLQKYGGRLNEHITVQMVLEPFLRVLQYLHTRGIIHRDIKPENILFSSGMTLKLADFGLAIDLRRERAVTRAGTLDYMAPEVLNCPYKNKPEENKEKAHLHYSGTVDSWAVGVLAYELLVGCPPFYDSSRDRVEQRIRHSSPTFPRTLSENARSFISLALTKDPAKRPSVLQLLNHPWINTFRARRSMRQVTLNPAGAPAAGEAAAAAAGGDVAQQPAAAAAPQLQPTASVVSCQVAIAGGAATAGTGSSLAPSKPAPATDGPLNSPTLPCSPRTTPTLRTFGKPAAAGEAPAAAAAAGLRAAGAAGQVRAPAGAATAAAAGGPAGLKPMVSAKSSPLIVADVRELQLQAAYGEPCDGEGGAEPAAGAARLRKKWLGIKLFQKDRP